MRVKIVFVTATVVCALSAGLSAHAAEGAKASGFEVLKWKGAGELSDRATSAALGLRVDQLKRIVERKDKLTEKGLEKFQIQFGRLPNGVPTFQVAPDRYFRLIPLPELERQPPQRLERRREMFDKRARWTADREAATDKVDHRPALTPVRDQGRRGTCVAFASCAEIEAILVRSGTPVAEADLSENLAYWYYMKEEHSSPCQDLGLATWRAAGYLQKYRVCQDRHWQYVGTDPLVLQGNGECDKINKPPRAVINQPGWGVTEFLLLPAGTEVEPNGSLDVKDTRTLEQLLRDGNNVVFGTVVAWISGDENEVIDVKLGPSGQPIYGAGGHAMMMVGFDTTGAKPYFIVKNSWGRDSGHEGYYYFSYDYIRTYAKYGYVTISMATGPVALPENE